MEKSQLLSNSFATRVVLLAFMFFQIECNCLVDILIIAWTMTHNMQTSQINLTTAVQPAFIFIMEHFEFEG